MLKSQKMEGFSKLREMMRSSCLEYSAEDRTEEGQWVYDVKGL